MIGGWGGWGAAEEEEVVPQGMIYFSQGQTEFGGFASSTASVLKETAAAMAGKTRSGVTEASIAPEMLTPPIDAVEARTRAAYWLAIAAEIAKGRGQSTTGLLTQVAKYQAAANATGPLAAPIIPIFKWITGTEGTPDDVRGILRDAAGIAIRAGVPEVVPYLDRISKTSAVTKAQKEAPPGLLEQALGIGKREAKIIRWTLILGGVAVAGFYLWPILGPVATSAGKVAVKGAKGAYKHARTYAEERKRG